MWYCYILRNTSDEYKNLTYNGSTNDPFRRLRQHNEEICGGAKATKGKNKSWEIYVLMTGFETHNNALSCEWKIKHPTGHKKRPAIFCGVAGRVKSLETVLCLDKWTNQCIIQNSTCKYILWLTEDMKQYVNIDILPSYITANIVPEITKDLLKKTEI